MKDTILYGDCRQTLPAFIDKARMCVTSPPYYGLRNYKGADKQIGLEQSPEDYVDELVKVLAKGEYNINEYNWTFIFSL